MTQLIATLSMMALNATLRISDRQHDSQRKRFAECCIFYCYAEFRIFCFCWISWRQPIASIGVLQGMAVALPANIGQELKSQKHSSFLLDCFNYAWDVSSSWAQCLFHKSFYKIKKWQSSIPRKGVSYNRTSKLTILILELKVHLHVRFQCPICQKTR